MTAMSTFGATVTKYVCLLPKNCRALNSSLSMRATGKAGFRADDIGICVEEVPVHYELDVFAVERVGEVGVGFRLADFIVDIR